MSYELIKNESGVITDVVVDGKSVKPMFMRGMKKAQKTSYWQEYQESGEGYNSFTGLRMPLNALELSIFLFCMRWYARFLDSEDTEVPVQAFDDMKYFLLELNTKAYWDLLD